MLAAWGAELALITARDLGINPPGLQFKGTGHRIAGLPAPGDYLASAIIFAPLSLLAGTRAHALAEAIGWAYVLATLLGAVDGANPLSRAASASAPQSPAPAPTTTTTTKG